RGCVHLTDNETMRSSTETLLASDGPVVTPIRAAFGTVFGALGIVQSALRRGQHLVHQRLGKRHFVKLPDSCQIFKRIRGQARLRSA
ncbi:hypothetical protein, partial [Rhodoferax sp.]|uniref:hypothetical protein n=1 Tax=Rhodoferax sp. TaxID=50421 RepID=UPI0027369FFE